MATPQETFGTTATQLGDMSAILKLLLFRTDCFALSAGVGVLIPTGPDTNIRVTDLYSFAPPGVSGTRVRDFSIQNQTWSLSPYLGFLATPGERFFAQGFWQIEVPLNRSNVVYSGRPARRNDGWGPTAGPLGL